jgi:hypothetical protein
VNVDRALAIYKERFEIPPAFFFTGSFTEEQILPLIEKYIASLQLLQKIQLCRYQSASIKGKKISPSTGKEQKV